MPVITPAYPAMNSTHNVSYSTLRVMREEITRGYGMTQEIYNAAEKDGEATGSAQWDDVFSKSEFFRRHKNFIQIDVSANDAGGTKKWTGFVESRLRHLIQGLETTPYTTVWPFPKDFDTNPDFAPGCSETFFFGLAFDLPPGEEKRSVDITHPVNQWKFGPLAQWPAKSPDMRVGIRHIRRKELPEFVLGFDKDARLPLRRKRKPVGVDTPEQTPQPESGSTGKKPRTVEETAEQPPGPSESQPVQESKTGADAGVDKVAAEVEVDNTAPRRLMPKLVPDDELTVETPAAVPGAIAKKNISIKLGSTQ
eukprot:Plantae.Rhodophyta-Rhodochaete_pulchella.ctg11471.p1 GENE.Plantae.Rhodophyta-Rhodochaete_pulchella.ctg11471~~Plantae.Rhodophyta-Rhodochaete_pulchella.ctg11471.p1  ORF type:complete len:309 (-),score=45.47 Plantae.Rhodophyta-Rhodochaete_pulchella.ctg11471:77-1003(-)